MKEVYRPSVDRLGMLDEHGHRQFIIPAEVRGFYNRAKRKVHFVLLLIFLLLPWVSLNGAPAILIDLPKRQFHFFGIHLLASDTPLIFFVLIILTVGLALMTALYGRVWCGWACPQTVFIEAVYRQIEKWTEGTYIERRKLLQQDWNFEKFRKTGLKWFLYLLVSSLFAHSFIAYWTGSKKLLEMMSAAPSQNFAYFLMVSGMTALLLFNFGWFREQFCVIMCPYGKFQSVLMDSQSVTVMYDEKRGEPRKGQWEDNGPKGDCVSCQRCVQVCPTGIDIRKGIQMECIACTACIDACDEIMVKVNKPKGLIRYKALSDGAVNWFRPRVLAYGAIILASSIALILLLSFRNPIRVEVIRAKDTPYQVSSDNRIRNHFVIRIENQSSVPVSLAITSPQDVQLIVPESNLKLEPQAKKEMPVFVEADQKLFQQGQFKLRLSIRDQATEKEILEKTVSILGPLTSGGSNGK